MTSNDVLKEFASKNPDRWNLALRIDDSSVCYTLNTTYEDYSLFSETLELETTGDSCLKRLENTIYDTPVILNEYKTVSVIIDSNKFVVVPEDLYTEDNAEDIFFNSFPEWNGDILTSKINGCGAVLVYGVDKGVEAFLQRTYYNVEISHPLVPLTAFFRRRSQLGNVAKMYVTIVRNRYYIIVFNQKGLIFANSYKVSNINDAAYFILGVWKMCGLDFEEDELMMSGDIKQRQDLMTLLRKYVAIVMPSIFPAQLVRYNRDAMNLPFDLILLSLCE